VRVRPEFDLPEELAPVQKRARRLEWTTIFFMATIVVVIYLAMGGSQAMKAAWIEDLLSFVPPTAFLVSARWKDRPATQEFPYGYHRSVSIAFLAGAVALTIFGVFILLDSVLGLVRQEHPSIGTAVLFGHQVWAGWIMIAALAYSAVPPLVLGRLKQQPARTLHDKTLKADADMNRADWLTAGAGIVGILGIGMGLWWADAAAAGVISVDIVKDGVTNLKRVVSDLMDQAPTTVEGERSDTPERLRAALEDLAWVHVADIRLREEGHIFAGEAFLVVTSTHDLPAKLEEARGAANAVDWRVRDIVFEIERVGRPPTETGSSG
jgi:cation diffusion facilitator family transporter